MIVQMLKYLIEKHLLAGFLCAQIQGQGGLFHGLYFFSWGLTSSTQVREFCTGSPKQS